MMPMIANQPATRQLNPNKLLLSKWTAVDPVDREKHFIVTRLIATELPDTRIEMVQIEALYSGRNVSLPWRALCDASVWRQGWL
jgi:tryptophan-rich hypothetical protein